MFKLQLVSSSYGLRKANFLRTVLYIFFAAISDGLVYQKHSGDFIGYVDHGSNSLTTLSKDNQSLASSVLGFYLRGKF